MDAFGCVGHRAMHTAARLSVNKFSCDAVPSERASEERPPPHGRVHDTGGVGPTHTPCLLLRQSIVKGVRRCNANRTSRPTRIAPRLGTLK